SGTASSISLQVLRKSSSPKGLYLYDMPDVMIRMDFVEKPMISRALDLCSSRSTPAGVKILGSSIGIGMVTQLLAPRWTIVQRSSNCDPRTFTTRSGADAPAQNR